MILLQIIATLVIICAVMLLPFAVLAFQLNVYEIERSIQFDNLALIHPLSWALSAGLSLIIISFLPKRNLGNYGKSRFATSGIAKKTGLFCKDGIVIGRAFGKTLKIGNNLSALVIAPPGTGKSASISIPTLLSCRNRSFLINDVKGELYQTTPKHRKTFSKVFRFSPAEEVSCQWNPLSKESIAGKDGLVEVNTIASVLYPKEDFWSMEARNAFSFFAMANIEQYGDTSLASIRESALGDTKRKIKKFLPKLSEKTKDKDKGKYLESKAPAEFSGIISSFQSQLQCFEDPLVANATSGYDFLFSDFRKELTTLYLCIQPKDIGRLRVLLNLFFELATLSLLSQEQGVISGSECCTTLLLDEFPQLGQLNQVIQASALSRGMRFNTIIFAQDYAQLSNIYGQNIKDVLDGSNAYRCILPQNNAETAERISRSIGNKTIKHESVSSGYDGRKSRSVSHQSQRLLSAQELLSMDENSLYIISQNHGQTPIKAKQMRWYKNRQFKKRVGELKYENKDVSECNSRIDFNI